MSSNDQAPSARQVPDANDYSRFEDVNDSDDEVDGDRATDGSSSKDNILPLHEAMAKSSAMKGCIILSWAVCRLDASP